MKCHRERSCLAYLVALYLIIVRPLSAEEGHKVSYKYQLYTEDDGRMEIPSHYFLVETSLAHDLFVSAEVLTNIMTGSSPTGLVDLNDPDKLAFAEIEDQRWAYIVSLTKAIEDHAFTFEYARSEENDYLSNGFTLRTEHEFNEKNTTLQLGLSYTDDLVTAISLADELGKESFDFSIGLTQLLTPKTILQANLTLGYSRGYLGDPYKSIGRSETFSIRAYHLSLNASPTSRIVQMSACASSCASASSSTLSLCMAASMPPTVSSKTTAGSGRTRSNFSGIKRSAIS